MPSNHTVKLKALILAFPILYLIHDIEEIFTVEPFLQQHTVIPFHITTLQFTIAFLLLWVVTFIGCVQAVRNRQFLGMMPDTFFAFLVPGIFFANGIGHFLQFLVFRSYVPGIITAILIIYPYSLFALRLLLREEILTVKRFVLFFCLGFLLQGPFAAAALFLAGLLPI